MITNSEILYDFTFDGFRDNATKAYNDALPRLKWVGKEAKKESKHYRRYPYERGGYYINYRKWIERKDWHFFVDKVAFHKGSIDGDVPIIMRFVSDTDGERYVMMLRVTENRKDEDVFAFSMHFINRYAERQLGCTDVDKTDVAHRVTQAFVESILYITTGARYGASDHRVCLEMGIGNGIAFGFYDTQSRIKVITTYVHQSMLRGNQHHVYEYLHDKTDYGLGNLYPVVVENGKLRPMNEEELIDYVEHRNDPDYQEKMLVKSKLEMEQNRRRWENKAMRGDSVEKRKKVLSPRARPSSYNPFD